MEGPEDIIVPLRDYITAHKRAKRAEKLFSKPEIMEKIIAACKFNDANHGDSGKDAFIEACKEVINASDEGIKPGDLDDFIDVMWKASKKAREDHENRPCW